MVGKGIINAYPDGSLRVNDFITRAEMLSLLSKVSDMITNSNSLLPEPTKTPEPEITEAPKPTFTPAPATDTNNWPAPLPPGNEWYTTGSGLTTSALTIDPRSLALSGSGFFKGNSFSYGQENDPAVSNNSPSSVNTEAVKTPKDFFTLMNGFIHIQDNTVIITDSDSAYLNHEYTLLKGYRLELQNSTLILMSDLNVVDEKDLIGDKVSRIIEQGGILNIGDDEALRSRKAEITPDTYFYDAKRGQWRAMK